MPFWKLDSVQIYFLVCVCVLPWPSPKQSYTSSKSGKPWGPTEQATIFFCACCKAAGSVSSLCAKHSWREAAVRTGMPEKKQGCYCEAMFLKHKIIYATKEPKHCTHSSSFVPPSKRKGPCVCPSGQESSLEHRFGSTLSCQHMVCLG